MKVCRQLTPCNGVYWISMRSRLPNWDKKKYALSGIVNNVYDKVILSVIFK